MLGENGAGKTTLMNILYGLYRLDSGEIKIQGVPVHIRSPKDAIAIGIGMVHQQFTLIPAMTVADQYSLAPLNTMTSIGMDTQLLMEIVAQRIENGTAMSVLGGISWEIPIGNYLYPYHNYNDTIPQSVKDQVDDVKAGIADGSIEVPRTVTDDPPEDPEEPIIPGFPLLYLALALATTLGVMLLLVNRSRRIANKHKS